MKSKTLFTVALAMIVAAATCSPTFAEEGKTKSVTYKRASDTDLEMVLHFPPGWKASDRRPAIVFFFGGGWTNGTIRQFESQAEYLASRGMVAARADYRVKSRQKVTPKECVEDAKSAVRYLRAHADELGIDPERIVASGGSAGGHIAACTSLTPGLDASDEDANISSQPNAMVLFNPALRFDGVDRQMARINGDKELGKKLSPTLFVTKSTPPAILLFGTKDRLLEQGKEYVGAAEKAGAPVELFTAEGQGHGFFNREPWRNRTLRRVDEFLASIGYLEGEPTIESE